MPAEPPDKGPGPNIPSPTQPNLGHQTTMGMAQVALILGVVALVLGGSAVGIALTHAGPTGATGGTGTVVKETYAEEEQPMLKTCAADPGSNISFAATGPGTIVVTASVSLYLQVNASHNIQASVFLWNQSASCSPGSNDVGYAQTSCSSDTCVYVPELSLLQSFPVTSAGTYTISVAGFINFVNAETVCYFEAATVIGVYYPS